MAARRKPIPAHHALLLTAVLAAGLGLGGCVLPGGRAAADALTPDEHLQLGLAYEHSGEAELALREYGRAATGPKRDMALAGMGNVYFTLGRYPEAEANYRAALGVNPDHAVALNNLAWLLAEENRSLEEAERLIRHAIALGAEPRATYEHTLAVILRLR